MKTLTCPHPKCRGKARWYHNWGGCNWYQCLKCKSTFIEEDGRRKRK